MRRDFRLPCSKAVRRAALMLCVLENRVRRRMYTFMSYMFRWLAHVRARDLRQTRGENICDSSALLLTQTFVFMCVVEQRPPMNHIRALRGGIDCVAIDRHRQYVLDHMATDIHAGFLPLCYYFCCPRTRLQPIATDVPPSVYDFSALAISAHRNGNEIVFA